MLLQKNMASTKSLYQYNICIRIYQSAIFREITPKSTSYQILIKFSALKQNKISFLLKDIFS